MYVAGQKEVPIKKILKAIHSKLQRCSKEENHIRGINKSKSLCFTKEGIAEAERLYEKIIQKINQQQIVIKRSDGSGKAMSNLLRLY